MKCSSNELKDVCTATFSHWKAIKRADNPKKELAPIARIKLFVKSNEWFKNITKNCTQQNLRIRNQLTNIFNFQFHNQVRVNNEILFNVFEISFTDAAAEILNLGSVNI
jgi:hypothetical protein